MTRRNVSEAEAERAIAVLKRGIEAAENSNQAGENFVVAASHAPELVEALEAMIDERWSDLHSHMSREQFDRHFASELAAIAKAKGEQA